MREDVSYSCLGKYSLLIFSLFFVSFSLPHFSFLLLMAIRNADTDLCHPFGLPVGFFLLLILTFTIFSFL